MAEQTLRPYNPSWADKLAAHLYDMTSKSPEARNFVGGLMGGTGLGRTQMGVVDATPLGVPLGIQEAYNNGDAKGMALAAIPMPMKAGAGMVKRAAEEVAGGMARAPYQRKLSPQGLYSWGAEAAYNLPQETMTVQQARSMLEKAGTKPDEFHWSGFNDAFPDPNTKVSRDQLVTHFETNAPRLGETTYGAIPKDKMDKARAEYAAAEYGDTWQNLPSENRRRVDDLIMERRSGAKFSGYTLPGGENYREVLTRLNAFDPVIARSDNIQKANEIGKATGKSYYVDGPSFNGEQPDYLTKLAYNTGNYVSPHWDEPNVLAHLRMSNRTDAGGNKLLHMEESQSDWGQAARKKGIKTELSGDEVKAYDTLNAQRRELERAVAVGDDADPATMDAINNLSRVNIQMELLANKMSSARSGVPNAPYIGSTGNKSATGWTDLNLKRALWEAAQNDADALAWTPGADQAARYDLSKSLDTLHYYPDTGELMGSQGGNTLISKVVPKDKLGDFVGKDVAAKLLESEPTMVGNTAIHKLSGQDLSVGGEGMKGYYDKIVPTQLGAVLKRAGVEGGEMGVASIPQGQLPTEYRVYGRRGDFVHGFDEQGEAERYLQNVQTATGGGHIKAVEKPESLKELPSLKLTPAMREQIKKGLPYFAGAPVGFGMMQPNSEER